MGRKARFFLSVLFIVSFLGPVCRAETTSFSELEDVLRKIESRHYRWIAIRANVLLFFAKDGSPSAMCGGELLYQRLDERMFLTCADTKQALLFIFRTFDRRFDLYLPAQNTVYHGSVFDFEDSPDIESHLKVRDLYRALKPMTVDPRRTRIDRTNLAITSLNVYDRNEEEGKLLRKLYLTPEGDVRGELFYNPDGRPVTEIRRYDFNEIRVRAGAYDSIIFPKKITLLSPETKKGSAIFFSRVTALDTVDPLEFTLRVPPGTREVFLEEKNPRFLTASPKKQELPSRQTSSVSVPAKPKSGAVPLKPRPVERPAAKIVSPPAEKKEPASQNADADIVTESPSPSGTSSDAQTTLDPSVLPSLEMGKT